jgi:3-oxoacyl-[acyl-carrier-protein] synthase II
MSRFSGASGRPPVRVAVTGIGVVSPAGRTPDAAVAALLAGRSTASIRPDLVEGGSTVQFGCAVEPVEDDGVLTPRERTRLDRLTSMAVVAATQAVRDCGSEDTGPGERTGVFVGTGIGGLGWMESAVQQYGDRRDRIPPHTVLRVMNSSPAAVISARLGASVTSMTFTTACASGASAIGEATRYIRQGTLDLVVAGGVDAPLTPLVMSAFSAMRALSRRRDAPDQASRPFDDDRDGFVMAEGSTFLVLERMQRAVDRGARIYGEVIGYGSTTDVGDLVAPAGDGSPATASVRLALRDAVLEPWEIGHVSAHGTSTVLNDRTEALALAAVFGPHCPPVTAPKGVVGHMIGAAGAFEAAMGLLCARSGLVPPVANFRSGRDAEHIDLVRSEARRVPVAPVLSTSFGFGGQNTSLVLRPA